MSGNLATLMVGLGYDLSALEKGAPEAFRLINSQTLGMSAEMKRASREGAESLRLIDESLGIHMSRPLTRILTQEFPALASGLQAVLGGAVFGAVATIGVEAFDKVVKAIEKAQKAEEEFQASTRKVSELFTDAMQSFEKADKLRGLTGIDKKLFEIDYSSVEEGRKKIDELAAAMEKEGKAAAEAHKWTTELLAGIGELAHTTFNSESTLGVEAIGKQFAEFTRRFDELSKLDALHGTSNSAKFIVEQIEKADTDLKAMKETNRVGQQLTGGSEEEGFTFSRIYSQEELDTQTKLLDNLKKIGEEKKAQGGDQKGREGEVRNAEALAAAQVAHAEMVKDFQEDASAWNATANAMWQVAAMAEKLSATSLADSAQREKRAKALNFSEIGAVGPPPGAPQLSDQAELQKVTEDQNESWKKAGQILDQIETPAQKVAIALQTLKTLEDQGRLSADQVALATQKLGEEMTKAELHVRKMQEELVHLLEKSTSASAGMKAFFLQLQIDSTQNGKFAFDMLNQGLKGFEDEVTKAVFTGKAHWQDYFRSLTESAFKFLLNKEISSFFQMMSGTGLGKSIGLDKLIPGAGSGEGSGAALAAASATLQTGSSLLITGSTALQAAAASLSSSGIGSGISGAAGGGFDESFVAPGYAGGTDSAPGGFAWVGEQGPELLNLPGGTSVTPAASLRSGGGGDQHFYIDAKGAEIGVEEKIVRALAQARPRIIGEALANFSAVQDRTLRRR